MEGKSKRADSPTIKSPDSSEQKPSSRGHKTVKTVNVDNEERKGLIKHGCTEDGRIHSNSGVRDDNRWAVDTND